MQGGLGPPALLMEAPLNSPSPEAPPSTGRRIAATLLIGPAALALSGLAFGLFYHWANGGMSGWIATSWKFAAVRTFAVSYTFGILLPIYLLVGILAWLLTLGVGLGLRPRWSREWHGRQALGLGLSAMLWIHLILWWEVPTALWVIPGLRQIPLGLLLPALALAALAYPVYWVRTHLSWGRGLALLALWLLAWTGLSQLPSWIPRPSPAARGGSHSAKFVLLGIDGLRSDTFLQNSPDMAGLQYENAYTPIPATRLLWHILWGGDPLFYTVGHVGPTLEEFQYPGTLTVLAEAKKAGWASRFYIDDGGTIGLAERNIGLDDSLMPAEGWENFANSNLAVSFPLYASWENWFKPFPTTNPWAPLDAGLKEALRLGRGGDLLMFHTCLAHQPIYLSRKELQELPRWWTLAPNRFRPVPNKFLVLKTDAEHPDPRVSPWTAYQIRMRNILRAWTPVWNGLSQDPDYRGAARILFSDHGERFHNVGPAGFRLQGIHGYSIDPWECRVAFLAAGPGFSDQATPRLKPESISLLGLRDGILRSVRREGSFDAAFLDHRYPKAPIRYHTLDTSYYEENPIEYRQTSDKELAGSTIIAPKGLWLSEYTTPKEARAKDTSAGMGEGPDLTIWKPLTAGGAHALHFRRYELLSVETLSEADFEKRRAEAEALLQPLVPGSVLPEAYQAKKGEEPKAKTTPSH